MKKILLPLFVLPMLLVGCGGSVKNSEAETSKKSKHEIVEDSLKNLDKITLIGGIYLGMDSIEYCEKIKDVDSLLSKDGIKIFNCEFNKTNANFHNSKLYSFSLSSDKTFDGNTDILARHISSARQEFYMVDKFLSDKYGKSQSYLSDTKKDASHSGFSIWDFDFFKVEYHQTAIPTLSTLGADFGEVTIRSYIKYSCPKSYADEEIATSKKELEEYKKESERSQRLNDSLRNLL